MNGLEQGTDVCQKWNAWLLLFSRSTTPCFNPPAHYLSLPFVREDIATRHGVAGTHCPGAAQFVLRLAQGFRLPSPSQDVLHAPVRVRQQNAPRFHAIEAHADRVVGMRRRMHAGPRRPTSLHNCHVRHYSAKLKGFVAYYCS